MTRRELAVSTQNRVVVMVAFDGFQSLDLSGPWEVFDAASRIVQQQLGAPAYQLVLASSSGGDVRSSSGIRWAGSTALSEVCQDVDTVLVAGGSMAAFEPGGTAASLLPWLRKMAPQVRRMASICTGAFALASAGLLNGRRATTHWSVSERLSLLYPEVRVEPDAIYVADPPFYCTAGISAAIDLSLALVEADLGKSVAAAVARQLVVYLQRPAGQSQLSVALQAQMAATHRFRELIMWMLDNPDSDLSVPALSERLAMSERHFSRQFRTETGKTPARFVEAMRLDRAKSLLEQTSWSVERIAGRAGFGSVDTLQRALRRSAGLTPEQYRENFFAITAY